MKFKSSAAVKKPEKSRKSVSIKNRSKSLMQNKSLMLNKLNQEKSKV